MKRIAFAIAVATLCVTAVSGTSQAAPIAPLPAGIATTATDNGNVTQVRWYGYHRGYHYGWHPRWHRGYRHCWWRHGYRHCW